MTRECPLDHGTKNGPEPRAVGHPACPGLTPIDLDTVRGLGLPRPEALARTLEAR